MAECGALSDAALTLIRASAYLREPIGAPDEFDGDFAEWIRLVADACDGLVWVNRGGSPSENLQYRRSVWSPVQTAWADAVIKHEFGGLPAPRRPWWSIPAVLTWVVACVLLEVSWGPEELALPVLEVLAFVGAFALWSLADLVAVRQTERKRHDLKASRYNRP